MNPAGSFSHAFAAITETVPPRPAMTIGTPDHRCARGDIRYRYESLDAGGRIRITTKSAEALAAIHDFLRFQVTEHRTANSGKVEQDK